jgi:hypothetical protein
LGLDPAFEFLVQTFDSVRNRYERAGADVRLRAMSLWRMVRPSGTEAPGARRCGQADPYDELESSS